MLIRPLVISIAAVFWVGALGAQEINAVRAVELGRQTISRILRRNRHP